MKKGLIILLFAITQMLFGQHSHKLRGGHQQRGQAKFLPVDFVNPFIGNPNTHPSAMVPWGMCSVGPSYEQKDTKISGFGHVHLSGVGCGDVYSNVNIMATIGDRAFGAKQVSTSYTNESASPGYFKVNLSNSNVKAEMTATVRTGITRFVFPENLQSNIIIDLTHANVNKQYPSTSRLKMVSDTEIEGVMPDGSFCSHYGNHNVFFVIRVSKKPSIYGFWSGYEEKTGIHKEIHGDSIGMFLEYNTTKGEPIEVRVGISYTSIENARLNLDTEQKNKSFEDIKREAGENWNNELSKINVEGGSADDKVLFYSALYHVLIHPNRISDVNGDYPIHENNTKIGHADFERYSLYSLWDTYRNVHPLLALVYPQRQRDMVKSMIGMYKEYGWLPKWEHAGRETANMVGDPATPVIVDTYLKGIRDFDINTAYEGMIKAATLVPDTINRLRQGLEKYLQYKYIPHDDRGKRFLWGPVSTTLEYCYADWTIAQLAKALGKEADEKEFSRRAMFYQNVFDTKTDFMKSKLKNGDWLEPQVPDTLSGEQSWFLSGGPGFIEGSAWQYTWFVPHDQPGLIKLMGEKLYVQKLQKSFDEGKFMLFNEPDMAYPFLFNYVNGQEWRAQKTVREVLYKNFNTSKQGLPGDDDCGTLSCWAVMAMAGFYTDCPASNKYALVSPVFNRVTISLDATYYPGKQFVIETIHNTPEHVYIQSMKLNGQPFNSYFLQHKDLINGGKLELELGSEPK